MVSMAYQSGTQSVSSNLLTFPERCTEENILVANGEHGLKIVIFKNRDKINIGRSSSCDVSFVHEFQGSLWISKKHVLIYRQGRSWLVKDLESKHGTSLNNTQLQSLRAVNLRHSDKIWFSCKTFHICLVFSILSENSIAFQAYIAREKPVVIENENHLNTKRRREEDDELILTRSNDKSLMKENPKKRRIVRSISQEIVKITKLSQPNMQSIPQDKLKCLLSCSICLDFLIDCTSLACSHTFCKNCISKWFQTSMFCPECRQQVNQFPIFNRVVNELVSNLLPQQDYQSLLHRKSCNSQNQYDDHEDDILKELMRVNSASIWTLWCNREHSRHFKSVTSQVSEYLRRKLCSLRGLTDDIIDQAEPDEIHIAAKNIGLFPGKEETVPNGELSHYLRFRLKLFLSHGWKL